MAGGVRQRRGRARVDHRGAVDAGRGDRPCHSRDVPVPAELAQHDHPGDHDPGVPDWHLRVHQAVRLLDQRPDALRHRPGDGHRRRRRDRRDREHRAPYARVQEVGAAVGDRRDARGVRRGRRDRHRAGGRVRAGRVLPRRDGTAVSTVLADHCVLGGVVGVQRRDADAGAGGAAARQGEPLARTVLHRRSIASSSREPMATSGWCAGRCGCDT